MMVSGSAVVLICVVVKIKLVVFFLTDDFDQIIDRALKAGVEKVHYAFSTSM